MDPMQVARDLIDKKIDKFESLSKAEVLAVKRSISKINENYVGEVHKIGIQVKVDNWKEHLVDGKSVMKKTGRKVWATACGWVVRCDLHPDIIADSIVNSLQEFAQDNGIESIRIGSTEIKADDTY